MTDLFGRTEEQLRKDIDRAERIYAISSGWTGNEGLALGLAAMRAKINVDQRCLRVLLGQAEETVPPLEGAALEKWRRQILR